MDKINISELPDDVLLNILLLVPTKVAVSTSLLSKRWKFLWMWLPKLNYKGEKYVDLNPKILDFIDKKLPLHKAPVIESFHLRLGINSDVRPENVKRWVEIAVSRYIRDLKIYSYSDIENIFPSSLFTCQSLVILKLTYVDLTNAPSMACLPSLKTLKLKSVTFGHGDSLQRLLFVCPVLEDLLVYCAYYDFINVLAISVPSLQSLRLNIPENLSLYGYVIDTPSLKYLKLEDWNDYDHYCLMKNMPQLREAYVDVKDYHLLSSFIESITSVKIFKLCSEADYDGAGLVFNQLEHLSLCVCNRNSGLLLKLLEDSPNLRVLSMFGMKGHWNDDLKKRFFWRQPKVVPRCLLSSLQIFMWSPYYGIPYDRDIAIYILKNACQLRTATFWADTDYECFIPNLQMIKELTLSSRASSTCELISHVYVNQISDCSEF